MKNSVFLFFLFFSVFFTSCKNENENYIENIRVIREYEGPAPDHIIFEINVTNEVYSKIGIDSLTRHILELNKSEQINYTNNFFGLNKIGNNKITFHFITPYFLITKNHTSDALLTEELNKSKNLKLILHFNKSVFEFKNK